MKSKTGKELEEELDKKIKEIGVKLQIYHFVGNVYPYKAITVTMDNRELIIPLLWEQVLARVNSAIGYVSNYNHNRTTELIKRLKTEDIYGVAICDIRDQFSRQEGRNWAKKRLLKHLKKVQK